MLDHHRISKIVLVGIASTVLACTNADGSTAGDGSDSDTNASSTSESGSSSDAGSAGTGAAQDDLGPCGRLASCIETLDQPITPFLAVYGPGGTCWEEFSQEQCWQDCRALYDGYDSSCGSEPKCCECTTAEHCEYSPEYDACIDEECGVEPEQPDTTGCELLFANCDVDSFGGANFIADFCESMVCIEEVNEFLVCTFENYSPPCDAVECILMPGECSGTCTPKEQAAFECAFQ